LKTAQQKLPTIGALTLGWEEDARAEYGEKVYPNLRPLPGRLASMTARGAVIIRRLAAIYCVSRGAVAVSLEDLYAAIAIWDYSIQSIKFIYGGTVFSALAQKMLDALERAEAGGLTLTPLRTAVGGHTVGKPEWDAAIRDLQRSRLVVAAHEKTDGRTKTTLRLAQGGIKGKESTALSRGDLFPLISPAQEVPVVHERPQAPAGPPPDDRPQVRVVI
jgi:hypothetical protein